MNLRASGPYLETMAHHDLEAYRKLVREALDGSEPSGMEFDACRAVVLSAPATGDGFRALCMLLEGMLANPELGIDDTATVVRLLKALARKEVLPEDVVPGEVVP